VRLEVQHDRVRWVGEFVNNGSVRLAIDGQKGSVHRVEAGIPQGSPAALILFDVYLLASFEPVEELSVAEGPSSVGPSPS